MTRRDVDDRTDGNAERTELDAIAWHLTAALDVVSDRQGRYHVREALQLLDAKRADTKRADMKRADTKRADTKRAGRKGGDAVPDEETE